MTFIDIGAHIGYFTALAASIVGPSGEVHAFEPTPRTFVVLKRNLSGRAQVRLNPIAVFSERTHLSLVDFGQRWSSHNSVAVPRLSPKIRLRIRSRSVTVEAVSLDEYVSERAAKPHIIKIDAENAELEILRGASRTLQDYRPLVCLEAGEATEAGSEKNRKILSAMAPWGYKPFFFQSGAWVPFEFCAGGESPEILAFSAEGE